MAREILENCVEHVRVEFSRLTWDAASEAAAAGVKLHSLTVDSEPFLSGERIALAITSPGGWSGIVTSIPEVEGFHVDLTGELPEAARKIIDILKDIAWRRSGRLVVTCDGSEKR
ncbi:hypothetical protein [Aureimonas psammosilenae]|uniref:hypothetical protein n=1 Tax=Aureimonas psammosilenae TaxID=2495496 RepID=UPI00126053DE|nr:hypothetical protein [Aureimonas psammosilenae]